MLFFPEHTRVSGGSCPWIDVADFLRDVIDICLEPARNMHSKRLIRIHPRTHDSALPCLGETWAAVGIGVVYKPRTLACVGSYTNCESPAPSCHKANGLDSDKPHLLGTSTRYREACCMSEFVGLFEALARHPASAYLRGIQRR